VRLIRAVRREFHGPAAFLDDPGHRAFATEYLADMVRPHGLALDAELSGQSYGEMAEALLHEAVGADEPVGTLVVAFAHHDVYPGRALATYLSHLCPGRPAAFAVCDQGSAAAFTALRLLGAADPAPDPAPALLIVVEQSQLPYRSEAAAPARSRGVAMLWARHGPGGAVRQRAGVAPAELPGLIPQDAERLVLGEALASAWPDRPAHAEIAPAGQPMTGVWWSLAEPDATGPVTVADYEPALGCFSCAQL
jgi:hypothetical protein